MINKNTIKELINLENIFYTSIIGIIYIFGLISIFNNILFTLKYPDFDHFVFVSLSLFIWIFFGIIYIEKLNYFTKERPEKDKQFILKPKNDLEHMIWFFIQIYVLISFFVIFIEWHNNIEDIVIEKNYLVLCIFFFSFVPFLFDAFKINKTYFIILLSFLVSLISLIYLGFFDSGCYQLTDKGFKDYLPDC